MWRCRVAWSGSPVVGPGLSTFYALNTSPGFPAAVRAFFASLTTLLYSGTTITVPNTGDVIDEATGAITGTWTDGAALTPVVGAASGVFAAGVGMQVRWRTGGIVAGRRVVGSTFLIPTTTGAFDATGTPGSATITVVQNAADAYIAAAPFACIWSRPAPGRAGTDHLITSASVPDRPSWLVSRRR